MGCGSSKPVVVPAGVRSIQPPINFFDKYTLGEVLGKGSYGTVRVARSMETNEVLAVKILDLHSGVGTAASPENHQREDLNAERRAMALIGVHPNTVVLREDFVDDRFAYLVMELCTVPLLIAWMAEPDLNEYTYARYFMEMARALAHIHSVGVVHRDVKHDNFMLGAPRGRTVKLFDFGLSAVTVGNKGLSGQCGTAPYMAPEMVSRPPTAHGPPSDVWSLGVMVYMAFFGRWPYKGQDNTEEGMHKAIRRGTVRPSFAPANRFLPNWVSEVGIRFVKALLTRCQFARPSAALCLEMDYLNSWRQPTRANKRRAMGISLSPMLTKAVRCGAFSIRAPAPDVGQQMEMSILQSAAQSRHASCLPSLEDAGSPTTVRSNTFGSISLLSQHPKFGSEGQDGKVVINAEQ